MRQRLRNVNVFIICIDVKELIESYYKDKIKPENPDYRVHGWESEAAARKRFGALFAAVDLNGKTLLDVGCGVGSLFGELERCKIRCDYVGIDILPAMTAAARQRQPKGVFMTVDLEEENPFGAKSFDVVYASGIFNLNSGCNERFLTDTVSVFMNIASESVVFNLLHERSGDREDEYFYTTPAAVEKLLRRLSPRPRSLEFDDGYSQNDFTVILRL